MRRVRALLAALVLVKLYFVLTGVKLLHSSTLLHKIPEVISARC
jgi:hypothetical protein